MTDGYFDACREFATMPRADEPGYTMFGLCVLMAPVGIPLYYLGKYADSRLGSDGDSDD